MDRHDLRITALYYELFVKRIHDVRKTELAPETSCVYEHRQCTMLAENPKTGNYQENSETEII